MNADDPRHGTYGGYWQHRNRRDNPCFPCRLAASHYELNRKRQQAYGRWEPWTDAEPVRQHVRQLMEGGMSIRSVATAAGVNGRKISHLLYGAGKRKPPRNIRPDYAATVLAVELEPNKVEGCRVARRLRGLVALGHSTLYLSRRLGVSRSRVAQLLDADNDVVTRETLDRVIRLYDELSMQLPAPRTAAEKQGATRARNHARREGWPTPLCWDNVDDPDEQPRGARTSDARDLLTEWAELEAAGESIDQAARRLGVTVGAIERAQFRAAAREAAA